MTKKSRDRRKAYRANKRYYLNLIRKFAKNQPLSFSYGNIVNEIKIQRTGILFYSEDKNQYPKFIDPINYENSTTK